MTTSIQLNDALSEEKLQTLAARLGSLPTADEFKATVEDDLWTTVTKADQPEDEIQYERLPDESTALIGYAEDDGEKHVPWWLTSFKWEAVSIGEEAITLSSPDRLAKFQNFVRGQTSIRRPELLHERHGTSNDIYGALDNFNRLQGELQEHLQIDTEQIPELKLPRNIFQIAENKLRTTSEFRDWFTAVANLCPPFDESLTALFMLNTKVNADIAREILPDSVFTSIETVGLVNNSEIYNENYFEPICSDRHSLLSYKWRVFDLYLPYVNDEFDYLAPLEAALYENWIENNQQFIKRHEDWFTINGGKAQSIDSQTAYAEVALRSPLAQKRGRAVFATLSIRKSGKYSTASDEQGKRSEIQELLETYGVEG